MIDLALGLRLRCGAGETVALATVVGVRGSTPRGVGAKMVVAADGHIVGTVGGGTGEAQVVQAALDVIRQGKARRVNVDLIADLESRDAPICGGRMDLFVEPIGPGMA